MTRIAGLVLAAGNSTRMGSARNKLVEEIGGRLLVAWPVDALLEAGIEPVVVVTGFEADRVRSALVGRTCRFVHHEAWKEGMGSSLAHGARTILELTTAPAAVLVSVGDLPGLRAHHVARIVDAARAPKDTLDPARIVIPTHRGGRGHPVLFGARYFAALARLSGDQGGRSIFEANEANVRTVEVEGDAVLRDVDTLAELGLARAASRRREGA